MADSAHQLPAYENEKHLDDDSFDKSAEGDSVDDVQMVKEVEELEDRIAHDEATEDEYRVEEAYEVALKVGGAALSLPDGR